MSKARSRFSRALHEVWFVVATTCVACGSDARDIPATTPSASAESTPPASDASSPSASSPSEASASSDGVDGGLGGSCFGADPGLEACSAACTPYEGCSLPGQKVTCSTSGSGSCWIGGFIRTTLTKCLELSGGDCARLKQCWGCSLSCSYLKKQNCSQAAEMASCCDACTVKPDCYDESLPICSAVAACK